MALRKATGVMVEGDVLRALTVVRQGARFADVTRWVGALDADLLSAYSQLAPRGERIETGAVQRFFPGLDASSSA